MPFENLGDKLQSAFKDLRGKGRLSESDIDSALREVRRALLEADVNFKVAKDFIAQVREKAVGEEVFGSLKPDQTVIKIVRDELAELLGGTQSKITMSSSGLTVIMLGGLQGAGITTTAGKLALMLKKRGKKPLLAACDVYRPAAADQLQTLGDEIGVRVYRGDGRDPVAIAREGIQDAIDSLRDVVIIDTAGRLHNKVNLMNELTKIRNVMAKVIPGAPHEVMLVLDGSTGQNAFEQARQFTQATQVTSLTITKLDGTAKGGVVIGISDQFHIPVRYIGIGEGIDQLRIFDRKEFVNALFGHEKN